MSSTFTDAFAAVLTGLPDAAASMTRGNESYSGVLCAGVDRLRTQDDYGRTIGLTATVRLLASAESSAHPFAEGDILTIVQDGTNTKVRIVGRKKIAGITRLTVTGEYE